MMFRRAILPAFLLLLPAAAVLAAGSGGTFISIQDNGRAYITESRQLSPANADGVCHIAPLPESLLLDSVRAESSANGRSVTPASLRLAYDPDDPASPFRVPTLVWQLPPKESAPGSVTLHYAADSIQWSAAHEAVLSDDSRSVALSSRALIRNGTACSFDNARVQLVVTDKGRKSPLSTPAADPVQYTPSGIRLPERLAAANSPVATFDLPTPVSLPARGEVSVGFAHHPAHPVETRIVYDGVRFDRFLRSRRTDSQYGTESSPAVVTHLSFKNETGAPLPPGPLRLLRSATDRPIEWIGSDSLPPLATNETVRLNLGPVAGITGSRVQTAFAELSPRNAIEESFEITIDNQTGADQSVTVVEHLYRSPSPQITAASASYQPGAAPGCIEFALLIRPKSQKTITYTVRYSW